MSTKIRAVFTRREVAVLIDLIDGYPHEEDMPLLRFKLMRMFNNMR